MPTLGSIRRWLPRAIAFVAGLMLCGAGAMFVLAPPVSLMGFTVNSGDGMTNVRVAAGGFHIAVGLIGVVGGLRARLTNNALLFLMLAMGAVVASRIFGIVMDGLGPINQRIWYREAGLWAAITFAYVLAHRWTAGKQA